MKRLIQPAASCCLALFAFAWPWDVYQYIPRLGLHVSAVAAVGLGFLWIADILLARRNRVPFELAWPAVVLLLCLWAPAILGSTPLPLLQTTFVLLFLATCHFAPSGDQAVRYLAYSAISIACAAAYSLLSSLSAWSLILPWAGGPVPTAYSLATGATLAFAHDLTGGTLALLVGFVSTAWFALDKSGAPRARVAAAAGSLLTLLAALTVALPAFAHVRLWEVPAFGRGSPWHLLTSLIALWLTARIAAKLLVARKHLNRTSAAVFAGVAGVILLAAIALPLHPRSAYPFLLGLAAACARAKHETDAFPPLAKWAPLPLAAALLLNLGSVHPENTLDPRNYNVSAAQDLQAGRLDLLERRMDFFEQELPTERMTHFWRAHAALRRGHPRRAALEFGQSLSRPKGPGPMLAVPSSDEQEDFLVRLRDLCSSLPPENRVFAYERALLAAGRDDSALATLRLRLTEPSLVVESLPAEPFAQALADLLMPFSPVGRRLAEWPTPELVSILEQWGARLDRAPQGFPEHALPLVLTANFGKAPFPGALRIRASGAGEASLMDATLNRAAETEETWGSGGWDAPELQPNGTWVIRLLPPEGSATPCWAEVIVDPDGPTIVRPAEVLTSPPHVPAEPAIRMWIP